MEYQHQEEKLCSFYQGINAETITHKPHYRHAPNIATIVLNAKHCPLCRLIWPSWQDDTERVCSGGLEGDPKLDQVFCWISPSDGSVLIINNLLGNPRKRQRETHLERYLDIFTIEGDPASEYGLCTKRNLTNTSSLQTSQTAASWIEKCSTSHTCSEFTYSQDSTQTDQDDSKTSKNISPMSFSIPARLVDLSSFTPSSPHAHLVDTNDLEIAHGDRDFYATLSYCWGTVPFYCSTSSTIDINYLEIPYEKLPKTVQDAFVITKDLNIKYLWIDALCIIQDSTEDWEIESSKMASIYSNCKVCIAADSATRADDGCFNKISTSQDVGFKSLLQITSTVQDGRESSIHILKKNPRFGGPSAVDQGHVARRGWTFQERILPPRTLHYTSEQVYFECRDGYFAENNLSFWSLDNVGRTPSSLVFDPRKGNMESDSHSRIQSWYSRLVPNYTRRSLTYPTDKLPAISGLTRAYTRYFEDSYLAGLWIDYLGYGLTWHIVGPPLESRSPRLVTFSWVSVDSPVEWPVMVSDPSEEIVFKFVDWHIEAKRKDLFGIIQDGWIIISGYLKEAKLEIEECPNHPGTEEWIVKGHSQKLGFQNIGRANLDVLCQPGPVWLLPVHLIGGMAMSVLLMRPVDIDKTKFQRIGIFSLEFIRYARDGLWERPCAYWELGRTPRELEHIRHDWKDWFGDCVFQDVTIV